MKLDTKFAPLGLVLLLCIGPGCSDGAEPGNTAIGALGEGGVVTADAVDVPLLSSTDADIAVFRAGDTLFDQVMRDADGLGPLYIRTSCSSCHARGGRGPGIVQKVAIVEADGVTAATDQSALPYGHTLRPYTAGGGTTPIAAPDRPDAKVTFRAAVPVLGRGYLEAVSDGEIERVEREQQARGDAIHGRIHRVVYHSQTNVASAFNHHAPGDSDLIGRFGLKARIATLDEFAADALQGDMGITSPLRPDELANPDQLTDDAKPGIDVPLERVNALADYTRLLEIPRCTDASDRGAQLFASTSCAACHVPAMRTASDYPLPALADIDALVFTDFLLHDMGTELADGQTDEGASSREWRTAPLIGLRFMKTYLHDGRAHTLDEAVTQHDGPGSEAAGAVAKFRALSDGDRAALLAFVGGL